MATARGLGITRRGSRASFTLIELLTVIAIIVILVSFSIAASEGVANKAARSRASAEIQAIGTALEGYKTDNEIFPPSTGFAKSTYASSDGTGGAYVDSSEILYLSLTGQTNFSIAAPIGTKVYMTFDASAVGNPTGMSYVKDPWSYSYGYSTGPSKASSATADTTPYNGIGFYDLWTTGGSLVGSSTFTNTWITNWKK